MENPIFTLEGVVRTKAGMEDFVGPLGLILQLLGKNKIEIQDISVALILEQYLEYLDSMSAMDLEVASEFVAMASHLLYIKTKMLLSGDGEVDELSELISSLEALRRKDVYVKIRSVTERFADMFRSGSGYMVKLPEILEPDKSYKYVHSPSELPAALAALMRGAAAAGADGAQAVYYPSQQPYSVAEKTAQILDVIRSRGPRTLRQLIEQSESRSEMVAVFVAVLELCRTGAVYLVGFDSGLTLCACGPDGEDAGPEGAAEPIHTTGREINGK